MKTTATVGLFLDVVALVLGISGVATSWWGETSAAGGNEKERISLWERCYKWSLSYYVICYAVEKRKTPNSNCSKLSIAGPRADGP